MLNTRASPHPTHRPDGLQGSDSPEGNRIGRAAAAARAGAKRCCLERYAAYVRTLFRADCFRRCMKVKRQVIALRCGVGDLMRAREAISALPGVVAAEPLTGRCALRVWQGEEVNQAALDEIVGRFDRTE